MFRVLPLRPLAPLLIAAVFGLLLAPSHAADTAAVAADGFIVVESLEALRGHVARDHARVRLKPGTYTLDRATSRHFIEISARDSSWDFSGVVLRIDTRLFRQFGGHRDPRLPFYCVFSLTGDRIVLAGLKTENFGDLPGLQSRNKIFNITGTGVVLRNVEITTSGSSPWGYGSLYGISGGDVRKMNGIRIGWPAKEVQVLGCRVHMRAMGHGIFVQGAVNTLIKDCSVDGLLRATNDILAECAGYAFDRHFIAHGKDYSEGVTLGPRGEIVPNEMIALSEDGIRLYPDDGRGHATGSTTIENCTVTRMRRGICTGLGRAADRVINCEARECVAAGFNAGSGDVLARCRSDAKYAEALCLPAMNSRGAQVDLELLDSRGGLANDLLAVINGTAHRVQLHTATPSAAALPGLTIALGSRRGYAFYQQAAPRAEGIQLSNATPAPIVLGPTASANEIVSVGAVTDRSGAAGRNLPAGSRADPSR